jgi:2-C-methyl-D-erythritol 4-phosphate cytidylyltransferase
MTGIETVSVVIAAAGKGARMGADISKQYLPLAGRPLLAETLARWLALGPRQIILVVAADDDHWREVAGVEHCRVVTGGASRATSVLQGLQALRTPDLGAAADTASGNTLAMADSGVASMADSDWVLVHDAARPCVRATDILKLYTAVRTSDVGGLLGVPVIDTVKEVNAGTVVASPDRQRLWLAQTPQMFRLGLLHRALLQASQDHTEITDEASAIEALGLQPLMVEGARDNIKVTNAGDLALAEFYLAQQAAAQRGKT